MSEELMLDVGQANEIKLAARRAGATNADLKRLSEGDMFAKILPVLRGHAKITSVFPILMTVKLGNGLRSTYDFRQALRKAIINLDDIASDLLNQPAFKTADQPIELSIVAPTVAELGFKDRARYTDICQRGLDLGYGLCPPELGPQVCLQYRRLRIGDVFWLAMEALCNSSGIPCIFSIERDNNGQWLGASYTDHDSSYNLDDRIVFVCRK